MILMMVKTSQSFFISQIDYQKISPADALISWKILMNNRDITAAIQPNQEKEYQFQFSLVEL